MKILVLAATLSTLAALATIPERELESARPGRGGFRRAGPAAHGTLRPVHRPVRRTPAPAVRERADDRGDVREKRDDAADHRRDLRARRVLTVAEFRDLDCNTRVVMQRGITYVECDDIWYRKVHDGGRITYTVCDAPEGQ